MPNSDKDSAFDDDSYDDILDDSFEDDLADEEYDDLELDDDEFDSEEDIFDDEWEDENQEDDVVTSGIGGQKEKSRFGVDMSFNAMAIIGAIVLGMAVLIFQVVTKKPTDIVERFASALHMAGSSDGPVFGQEKKEMASTKIRSNEGQSGETTKGFLYNPEILNSMEMELNDTPPMPSPIVSETQGIDSSIKDDSVPELTVSSKIPENQIPRPPTDISIEEEFSKQDLVKENVVAAKKVDDLPAAKEVLKAAITARKDKVETEAEQESKKIPQKILQKIPQKITKNDTSEGQAIKIPTSVKPRLNNASDMIRNNAVQEQNAGSTIEQKLDLVINRLNDMELQITQIREAGEVRIDDLEKKIGMLEGQTVTKEVSKPKVVKKVSKPTVPKSSKVPAVKKAPKISWELRAAQPGKAWVSSKGQDNMRSVRVGDKLSGVGRITAISLLNGRWIVQATNGQIRQ